MSDFKGFGTRIGRETRETKENNEKLSLRMADCIFEKLQHQMQKKNDIIKSNENLAKVRWVTSFKSHILGQLTLQFNGSTKNKYGGTRLLHLIGLTKSTRFAVLVQINISLDGSSGENSRRKYWWRGRKRAGHNIPWTDIGFCYLGITANPSAPRELDVKSINTYTAKTYLLS